MTDQTPPPPPPPPPAPPVAAEQQYAPPPPVAPAYGAPVPMGPGPIGKVRNTFLWVVLSIITLGLIQPFWFYMVHRDMKRHTGRGLGGGIAVLLVVLGWFFVIPLLVLPFLTSKEVGEIRVLGGQAERVSALTGLWVVPGILILIGPLVWFVKTSEALNDYWKSLGA